LVLIELVEAMGLTSEEWEEIKKDDGIQLRPSDFDALEYYFGNKKVE